MPSSFTPSTDAERRLFLALEKLRTLYNKLEKCIDDPFGDGSGDNARPPEGVDYNRLAYAVREALKALDAPPAETQAGLENDARRYRKLRNASMDERNRLEHYAGPELDKMLDE